MTEQRDITSATEFQHPPRNIHRRDSTSLREKETVETLHSAALLGTLELKMRIKLYRLACLPDTERERALDRILAGVRDVFAELGALSPQAGADDIEGDEHIGSIAARYMAEWGAELKARGVL